MARHNPLSFQINVEKFSFASEEEKRGTNLMRPNSTFFVDGLKRFVKNPVAMVSFSFIFLLLILVFIVPLFYPYSFDEVICYRYVARPDASFNYLQPFTYAPLELEAKEAGTFVFPHLFGTDANGHDYFIRVLVGARTSLIVGFFAAIIVLIIGGTIGALCGFLGGKFDLIVMRIVDVIPSFLVFSRRIRRERRWAIKPIRVGICGDFRGIRASILGRHVPPCSRPSAQPPQARIRHGRQSDGRLYRSHHRPPSHSELHERHHHLRRLADP